MAQNMLIIFLLNYKGKLSNRSFVKTYFKFRNNFNLSFGNVKISILKFKNALQKLENNFDRLF